jgi:hypothetical protein
LGRDITGLFLFLSGVQMENEYPKWLYLIEGHGILVQDADEEAVAREGGFGDLVGGTPPESREAEDERGVLKAKLKAAGVPFGGNIRIEKLRELAKDL